MSSLKIGFSRVLITPPMGVSMAGYFVERSADGVLDDLEANVVTALDGEKKAVVISVDFLHMNTPLNQRYVDKICRDHGLDPASVLIHCTHTHTGPQDDVNKGGDGAYLEYLGRKLSDAVGFALLEAKPVIQIGTGMEEAKNVGFIRRFRMKNGKIRTNPGIGNPDILAPIGVLDENARIARICREDGKELVLVNFGVHPDTVGGTKITADYPRFVRETVEAVLAVHCVFFNGAQGDVNHVNVQAKGGDLNGLELESFDDVARGYEHAKHMGRKIAAAAIGIYGKVNFSEDKTISYHQITTRVDAQKATPEQRKQAHLYHDLHVAGKDSEIPFKGMELTTVVAEAGRIVRLENGPSYFPLTISGVRLGPVDFVGIPGEPFAGIGRGIREQSGFPCAFVCCLTNGSAGYFPMREAYDEGGYEARSSQFSPDVADTLIETGVQVLRHIKT
ncbi:MAG TPA: hypothetical protein DER23_10035 [Clostridiales bacterium]|nr:hypothetical protein [Clostridiales bacterium]